MGLNHLENSIAYNKARAFAVSAFFVCREVQDKYHEYNYTNQFIRSSASVGANIAEALNGESRADFVHKLRVAIKECTESCHWIILLNDTRLIETTTYQRLRNDCEEIYKIITAIIRTTLGND